MQQQPNLSDDDLLRAFDAADRMAQQGDQQATDDARAFAQEMQRRGLVGLGPPQGEQDAVPSHRQPVEGPLRAVSQPLQGFNEAFCACRSAC